MDSDKDSDVEAVNEGEQQVAEKKKIEYVCHVTGCGSRAKSFKRRNDFSRHLERKHQVMILPTLEQEDLRKLPPFKEGLEVTPGSGNMQILSGQSRAELTKSILKVCEKGKALSKKKKNREHSTEPSPERKITKTQGGTGLSCKMISTSPPGGAKEKSQHGECSGTSGANVGNDSSLVKSAKSPSVRLSVALSDVFGQSMSAQQDPVYFRGDYPNFDESLTRGGARRTIRIAPLRDERLHSFPATHPIVWQFIRADSSGIEDWVSDYPRPSAVDIIVMQCNRMKIEDELGVRGNEPTEMEEEGGEETNTGSGFRDEDTLVLWELVRSTGLPFDGEMVMSDLRGKFDTHKYLKMGLQLSLVVLTVRETARQVYRHCSSKTLQLEGSDNDTQSNTEREEGKFELEIDLVRKMQAMKVCDEFFKIDHYLPPGPIDTLPSTRQVYSMASTGMQLTEDFGLEGILRVFEDEICDNVPFDTLVDLAALHMLAVRMTAWHLHMAGAELALKKEPTSGSVRLDAQWLDQFTSQGYY